MCMQSNLDKDIIDNELLENQADANQNLETEETSSLKDNEAKENALEKTLKLLKRQKLSKEDYQKFYSEAFITAVSLLKSDLKLAERFRKLPKLDGFRSDKYKFKGGETEVKTKTKILEVEYGLTYRQAWEIQQIDKELVKETIAEARKKGELPTRKLALRILRKKRSDENKAKKMEEKRKAFVAVHSSEAIKLDGDKYNIIYANPIYESEDSDKEVVVSIDDMKQLQIPSADDAVLFLWTTSNDLNASLEVVNAWGFTYRECAVWDFGKPKTASFCFETRHKILLVATKGDNAPKPISTKASIYQQRSEKIDVKPTYYYETIERMFPQGAYLDIFAKDTFNGKWTTLFNNEEVKNDETN